MKMKLHKGKRVKIGTDAYRLTTLCGRMNASFNDGMNIAETDKQVTCKFCLKEMAWHSALSAVKGAE